MIRNKYILTTILSMFFLLAGAQPEGLRILYIGDSITDGNWGGGNNPSEKRNHGDWNHLYGSGYMYLCVAHFMGYYPENNYLFFNRGISGNTVEDLLNRWQQDALDLQPDVISVLAGINDIYFHVQGEKKPFDLTTWEKNYRKILQQIKEQNPDIKIVLGTPFVGKSGKFPPEIQKEYDHLVPACAGIVRTIATDFQAILVDYEEMFHSLHQKYPALPAGHWLWDDIHPTPAGHRHMADLWIEKAGGLLICK